VYQKTMHQIIVARLDPQIYQYFRHNYHHDSMAYGKGYHLVCLSGEKIHQIVARNICNDDTQSWPY